MAGAASLSLLAGAVPDALATTSPALDASSLYSKVEPQRKQTNRFSGTEAEALKNRKLGKTAASTVKVSPTASKASKKAAKKARKSDNGSSAGALAAVVLLGAAFAANATRSGDVSGSTKSAASKPAASNGDTPEARAKSAQAWIDKSGFGGASGAPADTPEGRAADAQAWIDAWKKTV